jgi:hypothetical protein
MKAQWEMDKTQTLEPTAKNKTGFNDNPHNFEKTKTDERQ